MYTVFCNLFTFWEYASSYFSLVSIFLPCFYPIFDPPYARVVWYMMEVSRAGRDVVNQFHQHQRPPVEALSLTFLRFASIIIRVGISIRVSSFRASISNSIKGLQICARASSHPGSTSALVSASEASGRALALTFASMSIKASLHPGPVSVSEASSLPAKTLLMLWLSYLGIVQERVEIMSENSWSFTHRSNGLLWLSTWDANF